MSIVFAPRVPVQGPEHLILGFGVDATRPGRAVAVGGQRVDVALLTEDGGRTWQTLPSPGKGLRGAYLAGDELWVCGEYGFVARSADGGATFSPVTTGVEGCLFGVTRDDHGTIWLAGDGGTIMASVDDGASFKRVGGVKVSLSRLVRTSHGILIPTDKPGDVVVASTKPKLSAKTTAIGAGGDLMTACETPTGTVVVVGHGGFIARSSDGARTFVPVASPTKKLLCGVCATPSGRVVAVGDGGTVLVSDDDGLTFVEAAAGLGAGMLWCCAAMGDDVFVGGVGGLIAQLVPIEAARTTTTSSSPMSVRTDVIAGVLLDDGLRAMVRPWRGCAIGVVADAPPPLPTLEAAWQAARTLLWAADRYRSSWAGKPSAIWSFATGHTVRGRRLAERLLEETVQPFDHDAAIAIVKAAFHDGFQCLLTPLLHDAVADLLVAAVGLEGAVAAAFAGLPRELPYTGVGLFGRLRDRIVTSSDADYAALLERVPALLDAAIDAKGTDTRRAIHLASAASFLVPPGAQPQPAEEALLARASRHIGKFGDLDIAHAGLLASGDAAVFEAFLAKNPETRHELYSGGERPYVATMLARGVASMRERLPDLRPRYDLNVGTWSALLARVAGPRALTVLFAQRTGAVARVVGNAIAVRAAMDAAGVAPFFAAAHGDLAADDTAGHAGIDMLTVPQPSPPAAGVDVILRGLGMPSTWTPPSPLPSPTLPLPAALDLPPELTFRDDQRAAAEARTPYDGHWRWQPDGGADPEALLRTISDADADAYVAWREHWRLPTASALYVLLPPRLHARLVALGTATGEGSHNHWQGALLKGGLDVLLPALRAYAAGEGAVDDRLTTVMPVGDVVCALPAIEAFVAKKHKALGRSWILQHRPQAIAGAIAVVIAGGHGDLSVADAGRVLRYLDGLGARDAILQHANGCGPDVVTVVTALLDEDPLTVKGAKVPSLPAWLSTGDVPAVVDRAGQSVAVDEVRTLLVQLMASNADELHPGTGAAKRRLSSTSLAALSRWLFDTWLGQGADPKHVFCMLAVGVFGDDDAIRHLATLARGWPGESAAARAQQALDVLVVHGSDAALFQLSVIAEKSKFAAFKKGAGERIAAIAELRGLTTDELADRLVPTFGLEDDASTTLDFGPRQFTVTFDESLVPRVKDASGTMLKDLPKPTKADDAVAAKAAKSQLGGLKKDVKAVADLLLRRLERAMIEGRTWSVDVFDACFARHPLAFHVARRLLWEARGTRGQRLGLFRLAEDHSLADADDNTWTLPADATVAVVHPLQLNDIELPHWSARFADYELLQPFGQLGRPVHRLASDEGALKALVRHRGRTLPAPKLVFGLEGRGFRRYDIIDGGAFNSHVKQTAGVDVLLGYDGNVGMGYIEAGEILTIDEVTFTAARPLQIGTRTIATGTVLALQDVPATVLSEVIVDVDAVLASAS